jgi:ubiquinone/menaquinone biosynthesis C-methylase UbiE
VRVETETQNACAGPFGGLYDFYIQRPWLGRVVGKTVWGIDLQPMYEAMTAVGQAPPGTTILDVPCGGGVLLRALGPGVRYIGVDISATMLDRTRRRARTVELAECELLLADMRSLPLPAASADIACAFSGLHMVPDPERVVEELARCLRPAGKLIGATFLDDGGRRQRALLEHGPLGRTPSRHELSEWLEAAGIENAWIANDRGFATFGGTRAE